MRQRLSTLGIIVVIAVLVAVGLTGCSRSVEEREPEDAEAAQTPESGDRSGGEVVAPGETVVSAATVGSKMKSWAMFGRKDAHGDNKSWAEETHSYFSHIVIDFTNAAFPLLPDLNTEAAQDADGGGAGGAT